MTNLFLKFLGGGLLILCGGGIGWTSACRKREIARKISDFERFLQYVLESIQFRSLPGAVVLHMASQRTDFAAFCAGPVSTFSQVRPPDCLDQDLTRELRDGLRTLETAPHQNACDTLAHMNEMCRHAGQQAQDAADRALRLYPRMGACLGMLAAIVLA